MFRKVKFQVEIPSLNTLTRFFTTILLDTLFNQL